jgi:hypothetical protein
VHGRKGQVDLARLLAAGDAAGFHQGHAAVELYARGLRAVQVILDIAGCEQLDILELVIPIPCPVLGDIYGFDPVFLSQLQRLDDAGESGHDRYVVFRGAPAKDDCDCFHTFSIYNSALQLQTGYDFHGVLDKTVIRVIIEVQV